ncbi:putative ribonuclease H-like domain-containing protein, partial [Tanacetum coccineum]
EDFVDKPIYNRFSKSDNLKGVPHPLTGDYTPKPQQEIDDSLYVYGKKGPHTPETSVSNDKFNIISVPKEVSESKSVTTNQKVMSEPKPKEVEPSCATHVKTPRQPMKNQETPKVNIKNWNEMMERDLVEGYSFIKKKCFVCGSLTHLIRDCNFYEKKMAREAELKKQRVFNTGNGVAKLVWNNANRVNHAIHFVPRPVQLNAVKPNSHSVRPNVNTGRATVHSVRQNVNSVRTNVNTGSFNVNIVRPKQPVPTSNSNSFHPVRPQVNKFNQRSNFSKSHSPVRRPVVRNTVKMPYSHAVKGNWGTAVKTSAGYNWRNTGPNSNCNGGSNFVRTVNAKGPQGRPKPEKAWGSVTFGGSKGYITSKGRIRASNLEFNSVSFVKELGHFNLFSISQICDKEHKVLFTETECLVVSPDFKMLNENQILLKVPSQHNMYSFDMKTPAPTKDYACLIAKATSDESKLWHRRLGHINFKNLNKLVKGNLVRGLPSKVFFLATKDETSRILQNFIRQIKNQLNHRVKIIRSDNGTEFKNRDMLEFYRNNGIKQEYSNARTLQQNEVAKRMNKTLIKAARTMLADSLIPATFWAEAVSIACYIFNRKGIFDEASYDDEGIAHDFNNLPTEVAVSPIPTLRIHNIRPQSQILGDPKSSVQTRSRVKKNSGAHALVWILVDLPHGAKVIGTKWVYRNKRDERGVVVRNKARLVAQGHRQEVDIDYDEVFAPLARIEAIRLFLAFASFMGFIVYQMDVKSAFLYGTIDEEVYVSQPPCFVDPDHPKNVYKVVKDLYGLHQAPRAWYATLSTFLETYGYKRGTINKTLFIKKDKKDVMLVQVYVDDIIFGSTRKSWCDEFEALMKGRFQMSSMGELIFFLGLQVKQKNRWNIS